MTIILLIVSIFIISSTKKIIINLETNPTTGYNWDYKQSNNILKIDEKYVSNCKDNMMGCGGINKYIIRGKKEGITTLVFNYSRIFEDNSIELYAKYEIKVDKRLNVKIMSY